MKRKCPKDFDALSAKIPLKRNKWQFSLYEQPFYNRHNSQGSNDEFGASKVIDFTMEGSTTNGGPIRMWPEFSK